MLERREPIKLLGSRIQRNQKVFLSMQTIPTALRVLVTIMATSLAAVVQQELVQEERWLVLESNL